MLRFALVVISLVFGITTSVSAHDVYAPYPPRPVLVPVEPYVAAQPYYPMHRPHRSIFGYGLRGTVSGALAGLGAGYFAAQGGDTGTALGLSVSIGALSGAALGMTLGFFERTDHPGAYYASRDLSYGVLFGAMIGAIGGGIATIGGHDEEAILLGAAAGSLGGFGLGLLTGILEGSLRRQRDVVLGARPLRVTVARILPDSDAWGARVLGKF